MSHPHVRGMTEGWTRAAIVDVDDAWGWRLDTRESDYLGQI